MVAEELHKLHIKLAIIKHFDIILIARLFYIIA
jgi:hypothetical protein